MVNIEAVKAVIKSIEDQRDAFRMYSWHSRSSARVLDTLRSTDGHVFVVVPENIDAAATQCGTTLCIAGFATLSRGFKVEYSIEKGYYGGEYVKTEYIAPNGDYLFGEPNWLEEGAEALGLDEQAASRLFHYVNDNDVALEALKQLAAGVDPSDIEIIGDDDSNHCDCSICDFNYFEGDAEEEYPYED